MNKILVLTLIGVALFRSCHVQCDDTTIDPDAAKATDKDPWEKWSKLPSSGKSHSNNNNNNGGDDSDEGEVDVTETTTTEVHTKSKINNKKIKTKKAKGVAPSNNQNVNTETKEQFNDAVDETDPATLMNPTKPASPAASSSSKTKKEKKKRKKNKHKKKKTQRKHNVPEKKHFNYHGDFYPGSLWQYPYPYYHPSYGCGMSPDCPCGAEEAGPPCAPPPPPPPPPEEEKEKEDKKEDKKKEDKKEDKKKDDKKDEKKFNIENTNEEEEEEEEEEEDFPGEGNDQDDSEEKMYSTIRTARQLVPTHYYGPPSAGWGGFQPGHTGGGWGAPYWYKKTTTPQVKQLVPTHYYGPPSAGWGGFQPGHTGGGWGAPYWYKKTTTPQVKQLVPTHYYGPPSAGWGGFQPGHTGGGWGAPYWYKRSTVEHHSTVKQLLAHPSKRYMVQGQDPHGVGHTGHGGGWDHGFGAGHGFAWGEPNPYGMGSIAHNAGGLPEAENNGRIGMALGHKGHFGSGFAGWGNASTGDMLASDQDIGEGDYEPHHPLVVPPGRGHLHHNHNHRVGYGSNKGYKATVPPPSYI